MMSSTTEPSASSNRWVYWTRPGAIRRRSLLNVPWSTPSASDPPNSRPPQVAHIEQGGGPTTRRVLRQGASRITDRHIPATELHHAGTQGPVDGVQRGCEEGSVSHGAKGKGGQAAWVTSKRSRSRR